MSSPEREFKSFPQDYVSPGHPIAFSGLSKIGKYYKGKISRTKIENALASLDTYTTYYQTTKPPQNPYFVYKKRQQFQIDLIDVSQFSRQNHGAKYLISVIDSFTKRAWIRSMKTKSATEFLSAFESIMEEAEYMPDSLYSDHGKEMKNRLFLSYLKRHNIKIYFPEVGGHASIVERFNKTIQIMLYKYLYSKDIKKGTKDPLNYTKQLEKIVDSYNNSHHRTIGMTPMEAEDPANRRELFLSHSNRYKKIWGRASKLNRKKFKKGDTVRVKARKTRISSRAYDQQFFEEIYKISKVNTHMPIITYNLVDYNGESVVGDFYYRELVKVKDSGKYKIEKILKRQTRNGRKEVLVKWKGWDESHNSWIPASTI